MTRICDKFWEFYNEYSTINGVLIISREDFEKLIEIIEEHANVGGEE